MPSWNEERNVLSLTKIPLSWWVFCFIVINGPLSAVIATIHQKGHRHLYIDGGVTVQNFLKEDLIDEIIITIIPTLLGGGTPLFGDLPKKMELEHVNTEVFLNAIVQTHYRRKKLHRLLLGRFANERKLAVESNSGSVEDDRRIERIRSVIKILPARYQSVVVLRYYQQMSFEQIAAIVNCREDAVRTRLSRAIRQIRRRLGLTDNKE